MYPRVARAVQSALEHAVDDAAAARVFVTGHSLGGAHAMLTAFALADGGAHVGGVWTFAAPKVGKVRHGMQGTEPMGRRAPAAAGLGLAAEHGGHVMGASPGAGLTLGGRACLAPLHPNLSGPTLAPFGRRTLPMPTCSASGT